MRVGVGALPACLAFDKGVCAVQFDQSLGSGPGAGVEAINILRYYRQDFAGAFEIDDGLVRRIRARGAKARPTFELIVPMLDSGSLRAHEVVVIDGLPLFPHPFWPPKIGKIGRASCRERV